jgi:hypothetical protein
MAEDKGDGLRHESPPPVGLVRRLQREATGRTTHIALLPWQRMEYYLQMF